MSSRSHPSTDSQKTFQFLSNTAVKIVLPKNSCVVCLYHSSVLFFLFFIKCFKKKLWERSSPLSGWSVWSAKVHYDDLFLGSAQVSLILNTPAPSAQLSYDGLISHFLGRLGRHWTLGGVRTFHVGHEQAHFLIGPPPLRVQLTMVPKGHLRLDVKAGGQIDKREKDNVNNTNRYLREVWLQKG